MSDTVPIFEKGDGKKNKSNDIDYIEPRFKIPVRLWNIFRVIVSSQNKTNAIAITESIKLWINDVSYLSISHNCECGKVINIENDYFYRKRGETETYYCSMKCLIDYYEK